MWDFQNCVVGTHNNRKVMMKKWLENDQCSKFGSKLKALEPLISGCSVMGLAQNKSEHNAVCKKIQH